MSSAQHDELDLAILAELRRQQQGSRSENEWVLCIDAARALKAPLDDVLRRYENLTSTGFVELRYVDDKRSEDVEARVTTAGRNFIEAWLRDQNLEAAAAIASVEAQFEYDLFVSHASDDNSFSNPIVDELATASLKAWYDRDQMGMGVETLGSMNAGIKLSRSFVIIASPMYFKKLFTESELSTILYLALHDQNRKVIVVLYKLSEEDLRNIHPMLSAKIHIDSSQLRTKNIVRGIVHALVASEDRPPTAPEGTIEPGPVEVTNLEESIYRPESHNPPYDELDEAGLKMKPELQIRWYTPGFVDGVFCIRWALRNTSKTRASMVAVFLPGLKVYGVPELRPGEESIMTIPFTDRYAYFEIMKPPLASVVEFADQKGSIFRQYANVSAFPQWEDHDAEYISSKLGYPYRVSTRIVTIDGDDDDRFHRTRSIGWP